MKKVNIFTTLILSLIIICTFSFIPINALASDDLELNWYFVNREKGKTPEPPKESVGFFSDFGAYYVGDTNSKILYLTFDEGYENGNTPKILDILKDEQVPAAFFVVKPYIKEQPDIVKRMVDEGHLIGNHTISHLSLPTLTSEKLEQDIIALDKIVYEKWKVNMKYMRPPMGEYSERVLKELKDLGHRAVFWSFAYDDYDVNNQKGTDYAYKMIMNNLHNGEVMLLHAVSKDNTEVLDKILKDIKAQGYEFRSLNEI